MRKCLLAAAAVMTSACASAPSPLPGSPTPGSPSPGPLASTPGAPEASSPSQPLAGERKAASAWTANDAAIAMLKQEEALRTRAYQVSGQWLIGYGHSQDVKAGMTISKPQAEEYLRADVKACEAAVGKSVEAAVSRNEFSALVALCFNIGAPRMEQSSVVSRLNAGDRAGAAAAFLLWDKDEGAKSKDLEARRRKERMLFEKT